MRTLTTVHARRLAVVLLVAGLAAALTWRVQAGSGDELPPSLAEVYASVRGYGPADPSAIRDATERLREHYVAACMEDRGFDYQPYVPPLPPLPAEGTPEFRRDYGYGILTAPEPPAPRPLPDPADPNTAAAAQMDAAGRTAFYTALYGPEVAADLEADGVAASPVSGRSCVAAAARRLDPGGDPRHDQIAGEAQEAFAEFRTRWDGDERVARLNASWSACMAAKGFHHDRPEAAAEHFVRLPQSSSGAPPEDLVALELATAAAHDACLVDLEAGYAEIERELEQQVIAEYGAALLAHRDLVVPPAIAEFLPPPSR